MKKKLLLTIFLISAFGIWSQTIKQYGDIVVKTTPAGQISPLSQLSRNASGKKFVITDSILKNCTLEFYIKKQVKPDTVNISSFGKLSVALPFYFEIIPDRKPNESLLLMFYWQGGAVSRLFPIRKGYMYKWKEFAFSQAFNENKTPLLLVYEDRITDDAAEIRLNEFSKLTPLDPNKIEYIIKELYSVIDNFYLIYYAKITNHE